MIRKKKAFPTKIDEIDIKQPNKYYCGHKIQDNEAAVNQNP